MTWTCMVCGDERPDALIDVYSEGTELVTVNVRHCIDRSACVMGAREHSMLDIVRP